MTRIPLIDPQDATGKVAEMLDEYAERTGNPAGPMVLGMANSPALLRAYLDLTRAMKRARLERAVAERISLAVQQWIGCDYCIEAHTRAGRKAGLTDSDIALAREGTASDARTAAMVAFGRQIVAAPSEVADADVENLKALGWDDEQIAEVVGLVALNLMTGSFNLVAGIHPAAS